MSFSSDVFQWIGKICAPQHAPDYNPVLSDPFGRVLFCFMTDWSGESKGFDVEYSTTVLNTGTPAASYQPIALSRHMFKFMYIYTKYRVYYEYNYNVMKKTYTSIYVHVHTTSFTRQ